MKTQQQAAHEFANDRFANEDQKATATTGFHAGVYFAQNTWYENEHPPVSERFKPDLFSENVLCRTRKHTDEVLAWYDHQAEVWKIYPAINGKSQTIDDLDINEWRPLYV